MRSSLITAFVIATALLAGCSDDTSRVADQGGASDTTLSPIGDEQATEGGLPSASGTASSSPSSGKAATGGTTATKSGEPSTQQQSSSTPTTRPPGAQSDDTFSPQAPAGSTRVASGRNSVAEWRVYAFRMNDKTCLHFYSRSATGGGGGDSCPDPPLDPSTSSSDRGRFGYGAVAARVTRVRFEYTDGKADTFDAVAAPGYSEHFFGGELARVPLKRVVAFDASGKQVAENTDMTAHNLLI